MICVSGMNIKKPCETPKSCFGMLILHGLNIKEVEMWRFIAHGQNEAADPSQTVYSCTKQLVL